MSSLLKLGAVWPFIVGGSLSIAGGLMFAILALSEVTGPSGCSATYPAFCDLFLVLSLVVMALGAVHLAPAVGMWRRRTWGRWLGAALGAVGLVGTAWVWVQFPWDWGLVVPASAYGLTLLAAIAWYPAEEGLPA